MNKNELWDYAVQHTLGQFSGDYIEKTIKELLHYSGGNINGALRRMSQTSAGFTLGNFGSNGPDIPYVRCFGNANLINQIEAWFPESDFVHNPPDLIIKWREVFEYIKAGKKRAIQMDMFEMAIPPAEGDSAAEQGG